MRAHIPIVTLVLLLTLVVVPGLTAATANAEVITVCWDGSGDYLTIQEGIDAASDGDEVVVCDGVYTGPGNKNLDFGGKAITVRSENGPDDCIIDCEGDGRGFYFHSGETEAAVVDALTIRNGYVDWDSPGEANGAGICCGFDANPTITNCTITGGLAEGSGGGVACAATSPTILNCSIWGNRARSDGGGGGISCLWASNPTIRNCSITDNVADYHGGGICCAGGSPLIVNCLIAGNAATVDLRGYGTGGGISCAWESSAIITNCTITGNTAKSQGGGVCCSRDSSAIITNCILWGDWAAEGPEIAVRSSEHPSTVQVSYCDVEGGEAAAYVEDGCTLEWGDGNIDADPAFAFADDYHLASESPCIDAGTNDPAGGLPPDDFDGNPRPLDGDGDSVATADMGAYEFNPDAPSIACSPAAFEFFAPEGGPNPDDQILSIRNCGGGTLNWEISEECPWLEVDPASGQSTGEIDEVAVSVDVGGVSHGQYTCVLAVADPQAVNTPRTVCVTLYVNRTLHVPSEYPTIQDAIDDAIEADTVLVADGTYTGPGNRNLDFHGKAITVRSANGPDNCVIDCEGEGRGFYFHSAETEASVLSGFTIQNGYVDWDGPAGAYGGGIYCQESSPTISDCTIRRNTTEGAGGGICGEFSSPTIDSCTITQNVADGSAARGGAVYVEWGNPTITNCTIADSTATYEGGGIYCRSSDLVIANCAINGNGACEGGAVYCIGNPTISNCAITGNTAYTGGALYCSGASPTITNCVMLGNAATYQGGAVYCRYSSTTITNCILWGDSAAQGPEIALRSTDDPSILTVSYSDVEGGEAAAYVEAGCTLNWGEGSIDADPAFAFPDDLHLMPASPCIDAGTNDPPGGLPPEDLDGNARPLDGDGDSVAVADMGVYEFNPAAPSIACSPAAFEFYVPEDGPNPQDQVLSIRNCGGGTLNWEISEECPWLVAEPPTGQSTGEIDEVAVSVEVDGLPHGQYVCVLAVADPQAVNSPRRLYVTLNVYGTLRVPSEYPTIQGAIDNAVERDTVLVGDGTYAGPGNKDLDFGGKNITVRSENGPGSCIIDCEGDGRGFYFHRHETGASVVDGLTITNGNIREGGGVCCWNSSPTIINCTMIGNTASYRGASVYCHCSSPILLDCRLTENLSESTPSMHNWHSSPTLINCKFTGNVNDSGCGGVVNSGRSSPLLLDCVFTGNSSGRHGGAMHNWDRSAPLLINCTFTANSADDRGGAMYSGNHSNPALVNCTLSGNTGSYGGGLHTRDSSLRVSNSVLWGNSDNGGTDESAQIHVWDSEVLVDYSCIQGWTGELGGIGNIGEDPLFVDPDGPDDDPNTWEDNDYHLAAGSPCVDAGCNWSVPPDVADLDEDGDTSELTPLDLDGEGRFFDDPNTDDTGCTCPPIVDMGAYEFGETGSQPCLGDLDCDRVVGHSDLGILLAAWHGSSDGDLNCDGVTDHADLGILLAHWGEGCP